MKFFVDAFVTYPILFHKGQDMLHVGSAYRDRHCRANCTKTPLTRPPEILRLQSWERPFDLLRPRRSAVKVLKVLVK